MSIQLQKKILSRKIECLKETYNELTSSSSAQELLALEKSFFFKYSTLRRILTGSEAPAGDNGAIDEEDEEIDREIRWYLSDNQPELDKGWFVECCLKLLCDEARFKNTRAFENGKEPDTLNLQDGIVLLGCNWDVIHVIYDYITKPNDSNGEGGKTVVNKINTILTALDKKLYDKKASIEELKVSGLLTKLYSPFDASLEEAAEFASKLLKTFEKIKCNKGNNAEDFNSADWDVYSSSIKKFLGFFAPEEKLIEIESSGDKLTAKEGIESLNSCNALLSQGLEEGSFDSFLRLNDDVKNNVKEKLTRLCNSIVKYIETRDAQESTEPPKRAQIQKPAETGEKSDVCEQVIKGIASLVQCCGRIAEAKESQQASDPVTTQRDASTASSLEQPEAGPGPVVTPQPGALDEFKAAQGAEEPNGNS